MPDTTTQHYSTSTPHATPSSIPSHAPPAESNDDMTAVSNPSHRSRTRLSASMPRLAGRLLRWPRTRLRAGRGGIRGCRWGRGLGRRRIGCRLRWMGGWRRGIRGGMRGGGLGRVLFGGLGLVGWCCRRGFGGYLGGG